MKRVGVLALQGDVPEHRAALLELLPPDAVRLVRSPEELEEVDALVLPGGESTTISGLLKSTGLAAALKQKSDSTFPIFATCAGLVLLARELEPSPGGRDPELLGLLDVRVRRNDYGRQSESFEATVSVTSLKGKPFPGVFIRSPRILSLGPGASAFGWRGEEVVAARQGSVWGIAFHPELSGDRRLLGLFLSENGLVSRASHR